MCSAQTRTSRGCSFLASGVPLQSCRAERVCACLGFRFWVQCAWTGSTSLCPSVSIAHTSTTPILPLMVCGDHVVLLGGAWRLCAHPPRWGLL